MTWHNGFVHDTQAAWPGEPCNSRLAELDHFIQYGSPRCPRCMVTYKRSEYDTHVFNCLYPPLERRDDGSTNLQLPGVVIQAPRRDLYPAQTLSLFCRQCRTQLAGKQRAYCSQRCGSMWRSANGLCSLRRVTYYERLGRQAADMRRRNQGTINLRIAARKRYAEQRDEGHTR